MSYAMCAVSETSQRISSHRRSTTLSNWSNRNLCVSFVSVQWPSRKSVRSQRNPCRRQFLCIYIFKSLLLIGGRDKSNHIRETCRAQAEEMLKVYMMSRRKRPCYPHRHSSNICDSNFSVREFKFSSFERDLHRIFLIYGLIVLLSKSPVTSPQAHKPWSCQAQPCQPLFLPQPVCCWAVCLYQPEDAALTFQQNNYKLTEETQNLPPL